MRIHYLPTYDSEGYAPVITVHDPARMLTPAPDLPYIEIDETTNSPLYYDVLLHPSKYLVDAQGNLYVDEEWTADEAF